MNDHSKYADQLPLYVSGALTAEERRATEKHLARCPICQSDLALWRAVGVQVTVANRDLLPPSDLVDRALGQADRTPRSFFFSAAQLLRAQVPLVRSDLWPASAAVVAIGMIVATIVHDVAILRMLAPLVAAASIAVIYGPENDPALELTLATATSPWKILLARLTLVFGYDFGLALAASLGMLAILPAETVARLILDWLGPMTFLSAAALLLALWIGTGNAILTTYAAWLLRFLPGRDIAERFQPGDISLIVELFDGYRQLWMNSLILVVLAAALLAGAAWLACRQEHRLPHCA